MDACPATDLIIVGTRALMLLICTLSGPYAIRLGVGMYQQAVTSKSSGEVTGMGYKLVIKSAGPGLFLIAFGVGLLVVIVGKQVVLNDSATVAPKSAPTHWMPAARPASIVLAQASSVPRPVGVNAAPSSDAKVRCVIYTRTRAFASGTDPLSKESIVANLAEAAVALRTAGSYGIANPLARADVINGLDALRTAAEAQ